MIRLIFASSSSKEMHMKFLKRKAGWVSSAVIGTVMVTIIVLTTWWRFEVWKDVHEKPDASFWAWFWTR